MFCKRTWLRADKNRAHFKMNKIWWTSIKLKMLLLKDFLLVWYSNTKIIFSMIELIFVLRIDFKNWKYPIFDCPKSSCLTRYEKNFWGSSFGCKNILNFICHTMRFHNSHQTNMHFEDMKKAEKESLLFGTSGVCPIIFLSRA